MGGRRFMLLVRLFLGFVLLPGAVPLAQGAVIFVSTNGSDASGDGSLGNPYRTIGRALAVAAPGDEIVLRGAPALSNNIYVGSIRIQRPNTTIRSHDGEWAVIECPVNDPGLAQCVRFDVDSDGSRLQRVEVTGGYYYGISLETKWDWGNPNDRSGALNILLEDIRVHHTGNAAIKVKPGCDDLTVRRAELSNTGLSVNPESAEGIDNVNGDRMVVQDSYIHDTTGTGLYFKGGAIDCLVERTRIERTGGAGILVGFDTSPEYFDLTVNPEYYESIRGVVRNNIIRDTPGPGIGLYAAKDATISNNTLIDTAQQYQSPIYFGITYQDWDPHALRPPTLNPLIQNNVVHQSAHLPGEIVFIRYSNDLGGLSGLSGMPRMDHNLYFHAGSSCEFTDQRPSSPLNRGSFSQWQAHIHGESHSLTSAPQLSNDGHLLVTSPAIDAGTCDGAPIDDFDGDSRPQGATCDIGADESTYPPTTYTLTVVKNGTGSGTVTSEPPGINCGSDCAEAYVAGTSVALRATADPGMNFVGWSGDPDCSDGIVTMNADLTCRATFDRNSFTLAVSKAGNGSGTVTSSPAGIACGTSCSASFGFGTVVTLAAVADTGSTFSGWSGDPDCSDGIVTMNLDQRCVATFTLVDFTLAVSKVGNGSGKVTSSPGGIDCGTTCNALFRFGTVVTLTASAYEGSNFAGWGGDPDCSDGVVTMNADKACIAAFFGPEHTLTVGKTGDGEGTVTSVPGGISCGSFCSATFPSGTWVSLTALPAAGSSFGGWSGDCSGPAAATSFFVDRDMSCVAAFRKLETFELWLPVVANLGGFGGSHFYSDVAVANVGSEEANVSVTYYPAGGSPVVVEGFVRVGAGRQAVIEDVVGRLGKAGTKGVLRLRGTQPLLVGSRTYNKLAAGNSLGLTEGTTFGQYVEAYRGAEALGPAEEAYVLGLRQGARYRTNLAVANVGSGEARVRVTLYKGDGVQVAEYEVTLPAGQLQQDNEVFVHKAGLSEVDSGWAKVRALAGQGVLAYASVLDNVATAGQKPSDPTTMPMKRR